MNTNNKQQYLSINFPILLTVKEASKVLHLKSSTIYEHVKQGILPAYKIGGKILFKENELLKFIECSKLSIEYQYNSISNTSTVRSKNINKQQSKVVNMSHDSILQKLSAI